MENNSKRKRSRAKGLAIAAIGGLGVSLAGAIATAGPALADPIKVDVNFSCTYPLIGTQPTPITIESDFPKTIAVGQQTPPFHIKATAHLSPTVVNGLRSVKATKLEGTATSDATVSVPEDPNLPVSVDVTMAPTPVPAAGQGLELVTEGDAPQLTFSQDGHGKITLTGLSQHIDPKKADGTSVWSGGKDVACTMPDGPKLFAEFDITKGGPTPPPTPTPTPPTPTPTPPTPTPTPPTPTPTPPTPTPSGGQHYDFTLKGETFVKTPNGKAPLSGTVGADLNLDTGDVAVDLQLAKTKGNFQILGFLPVTADIQLVNAAPTTGLYKDGQLTTTSHITTKLTSFNVFGAIPIGGGDKCQTTKVSDIVLKSEAGKFFNPEEGGNIKGDYELSSIDNCGPLTGILSLFTAGKGNTITMDLTPKPGA